MAFEDGCIVSFYDDAVLNNFKTKKEGHPVYDDVVMVKIVVPNQLDCVPRPVQDKDKQRFPKSWEAYEKGSTVEETGYLLKEWAQIRASELKICQANNIFTVEMLANVSDQTLPRLGPHAVELRKRAAKFLEVDNRIEEMQSRITALEAENEDLKAKPKRAPRRHKVAS
ncbi:MAG: hypothetical protein KTR33_13885 [Gammaproteobacteria bacterium]|nr:hypothetical protein [Gammaproteobacteria bacterium]